MATLGEVIRAHRKDLGLSIDELAKVLGKDRSTLYRYEKNEIEKIPAGIIVRLAECLKCPVETLLEEAGDDVSSRVLPAERTLLFRFRSMNEQGQSRVLDFAADMARIREYRLSSVEEESLSGEELDYLLADLEELDFWKEKEKNEE